MKRFRTTAMALSLFAAPLALFACSSDSSADTTVAAETTVAESATDTTSAADTTAAADTTVAADTAAAADTTAVATDATIAPDVTAAADGTAAAAPTGPLTIEQVKGAFAAMGLTSSDKEIACVQKESGSSIDLTADEPPAGFIKALMVCAPDSMAKAAAGSIDANLEQAGVSTTDATCFMKSTFKIVGSKDLDQVEKLFGLASLKDFPQDVKDEILADAKSCGLNLTQMAALLAG